jgi:hypothetical protein
MNHSMPNVQFLVTAALIILATAWVLISYARAIHCAWCRHPYAIWPRECGDLCRSCSRIYDLHVTPIGHRRRPLWRRFWRPAA